MPCIRCRAWFLFHGLNIVTAPWKRYEGKCRNNGGMVPFIIAGGKGGTEVSWQVTGIRKDPYAVANPMVVEQEKLAAEKGTYLHPELYNEPATKGMNQMGGMQPGTMQPTSLQAAGQLKMK